jgi:N6-L-threonylcarbamoyladenine synthase
MRILAIETSCDETALALVDISGSKSNPKIKIIKDIVASQIKLHAKFGGVVPNLAKREHLKNLPILLSKVVASKKDINSIDLIAVTVGPGLEPALWTGIQFAKELSEKWKKPIVGVNHLSGHLYSFLLSKKIVNPKSQIINSKKIQNTKNIFPAISLIVSGGHTILAYMKNAGSYKKLGETLDDAVGESFDKVARLLNLPYPGGPALEQLARKGNKNAISFPSPMISQKNYDFSYSGLKTSVLYYLKNLGSTANDFSLSLSEKKILQKIESQKNLKADIAASFQRAAFAAPVKKSIMAAKEYKAKSILIGGGVAANKNLAEFLSLEIRNLGLDIKLIVPPLKYCMDNAVMIALASYMKSKTRKKYPLRADGNLNL